MIWTWRWRTRFRGVTIDLDSRNQNKRIQRRGDVSENAREFQGMQKLSGALQTGAQRTLQRVNAVPLISFDLCSARPIPALFIMLYTYSIKRNVNTHHFSFLESRWMNAFMSEFIHFPNKLVIKSNQISFRIYKTSSALSHPKTAHEDDKMRSWFYFYPIMPPGLAHRAVSDVKGGCGFRKAGRRAGDALRLGGDRQMGDTQTYHLLHGRDRLRTRRKKKHRGVKG